MKKLVYAALALLAFPAWGMAQEEDRLLQLLKSELEYNMDELRKQELPPYYMSLRVNETYRVDLASSFGAMSSSNETEGRTVVPQIRLGNPELDNFKYMNQGIPAGRNGQTPQGAMLPLGDDAVEGIREAIWRETLKRYDYAVDIYNQSKSQAAVSVEDEDKAPASLKPRRHLTMRRRCLPGGSALILRLGRNGWTRFPPCSSPCRNCRKGARG